MRVHPFKVFMAGVSTLLGFALTYVALNLDASPVAVERWLIQAPVQSTTRTIATVTPPSVQEEIGVLFQQAREQYISGQMKECAETLKELQDKVKKQSDVRAASF